MVLKLQNNFIVKTKLLPFIFKVEAVKDGDRFYQDYFVYIMSSSV